MRLTIFLIGLLILLGATTLHQTIQFEIISNELDFTKHTLDYFMKTPEGQELRDEIFRDRMKQTVV